MDRKDRQGFALIVALSMMALIVLLIISLSTLGNIQRESASSQLKTEKARAQARYGLELALGRLTELAGDDRRSTSRSDLIAIGGVKEAYWTGVWKGGRVEWLVSKEGGETVDPESYRGSGRTRVGIDDRSVLIGQEDVEGERREVNVPLVVVYGEDVSGERVPVGRYGYWVGDEGVKASLQAGDFTDYAQSLLTSNGLRQRANAGHYKTKLRKGILNEELVKMGTIEQLKVRGIEAEGKVLGDWTLCSRGLLTNPREGGLKLNLEAGLKGGDGRFDDVFSNGAIDTVLALIPELDEKGEGRPYYMGLEAYRALGEGMPYLHLGPVITEVATRFTVFEKSGKPALRYFTEVELWNPYGVPMLYRETDTRAFKIGAGGYPWIEIENETRRIKTEGLSIDGMKRPGIKGDRGGNDIWISISEDPVDYGGAARLKAGEVYRVAEPDPRVQAEGLWKDPEVEIGVVGRFDELRIRGTLPEKDEGLYFQLELSGEDPEDGPEGDPVFQIGPIGYEPFEYSFETPLDGGGENAYLRKGRGVDVGAAPLFAFHLGLAKRDEREMSRYLYGYDFRRPEIILNRDELGGAYQAASLNPLSVAEGSDYLFSEDDIFWDRVTRDSLEGSYGDVRLYEYPIKEPISIADLRHLSFKGKPPLAIGSPEGGELNEGFDRYFYSTVSEDWIPNEGEGALGNVWGNTYLELTGEVGKRRAEELRSAQAGKAFYQRGAFNLNSTSVPAWTAVLQQSFEAQGWRYRDVNGYGHELEAEAMFFRMNQSADQDVVRAYEDGAFPEIDGNGGEGRNAQMRQGFRWMTTEAVERLAASIVEVLKERGKAYETMEAVLADGLFERALERSGINDGMLEYGTAYLRQSDLMAALVLTASVRTDTFIIRTYGDTINPATGVIEGRAILEAKVQRVYAYVNGEPVESYPVDERALLRRFKVVEMRWLQMD